MAEPTAAVPLDQGTQAVGKDKSCGTHLDDLDLASRYQQIEGAAADAGKSAGIGNPHADRLDRQG